MNISAKGKPSTGVFFNNPRLDKNRKGKQCEYFIVHADKPKSLTTPPLPFAYTKEQRIVVNAKRKAQKLARRIQRKVNP